MTRLLSFGRLSLLAFLVGGLSLGLIACDSGGGMEEEMVEVSVEGVVVDATGKDALLAKSGRPSQVAEENQEPVRDPETVRPEEGKRPGDVSTRADTLAEGDQRPQDAPKIEDQSARPLQEDGDPIEGAEVGIYLPNEDSPQATATTESDGSYELAFTITEEEAPPEMEIEAEAQHFTTYTATIDFEPETAPEITYDIALEELGPDAPEVLGTVTDFNTGNPIEDATVTGYAGDAETGERLFRTETGATGEYEMRFAAPDADPDEMVVEAEAEGYRVETRRVEFGAEMAADMSLVDEDDESLAELPGEPDESVTEATEDFSAPPTVETEEEFEEQVSTETVDGVEQRILRTEIEIIFEGKTTVEKINEVLDQYDARIVDMLPGLPFITVRIPDPGNLNALRDLTEEIASKSQVEDVREGGLPRLDKLPDHLDPGSGVSDVRHHLAVRGHAAWNLQRAIEDEPWLVIADGFGDGMPDSRFTGNFEAPGDFGGEGLVPPLLGSNDHGYQVLSVINAQFANAPNVTGIFPGQLRIRAVDGQKPSPVPSLMNRVISRITDILEEDSDANIVVNTSLGWYPTGRIWGEDWRLRVKGLDLIRQDLEDEFVHFTSAGNQSTANDPAYRNSPFTYAALGPDMSENLENTFVVENRGVSLEASERPKPDCTHQSSVMPGSLSGMGVGIQVLGDGGDQSGETPSAGTSLATPQAAGTAAYMWAVNPTLEVSDVMRYIEDTSRERSVSGGAGCRNEEPAPVIDTYDAVLAAGGDDARKALLDVTKDDRFDQDDIEVFLDEWSDRDGQLDYSRYDLNGTGQTGGDATDRFDLSQDISFGTVTQTIEGETIEFDESALTDEDVLCYYAYSDLYGGDAQARTDLLTGPCLGEEEVEATISGVVTDGDTGDPIEGATVTGTDGDTGEELFDTETDGFGEYEATFTVDNEPNEVAVEADAEGYEAAEETVPFSEEMTADLTLAPATGGSERSYGPEHRYAPGDGYEYFVTVEEYDVNDDIPALLDGEFGDNAELAEWNDLKDFFSNDESALISFLDGIGMKRDVNGYVQSAFVTRGGDRYHSTSMPRHYYVNRFDGDVPSGWLVHDDLHSNRLSLGSWDNDREAMVRVPESEEDPSAKE